MTVPFFNFLHKLFKPVAFEPFTIRKSLLFTYLAIMNFEFLFCEKRLVRDEEVVGDADFSPSGELFAGFSPLLSVFEEMKRD